MAADGFRLLSPGELGLASPDASVLFDRDLAERIAEPFFCTKWDMIYVGSRALPDVCWCWDPEGGRWDDLTGGFWVELDVRREWADAVAARTITRGST